MATLERSQVPGGRWQPAMRKALELAQSPDAPFGENPRVGCVIVDAFDQIVGAGYHRGAGTPHAEVVALQAAGERARGATAVVTLEPCRHTGRTGPCTQALLAAGISEVVYASADPSVEAQGGATELQQAGVRVIGGVLEADGELVNRAWLFAVRHGRPLVTWKCATTLDGRVAGPDGGPTPITGPLARERVHQLRAQVGAIIVGTGTVLADDPALTIRGIPHHGPAPLRVVVGIRPIPPDARVLDHAAQTLVTDERDPHSLLTTLYERGVRHALLEGGPTLAGAFLRAHMIDRVDWYVAPMLFGAGPVALPAVEGVAAGVDVDAVVVVGEDVRVEGWVAYH